MERLGAGEYGTPQPPWCNILGVITANGGRFPAGMLPPVVLSTIRAGGVDCVAYDPQTNTVFSFSPVPVTHPRSDASERVSGMHSQVSGAYQSNPPPPMPTSGRGGVSVGYPAAVDYHVAEDPSHVAGGMDSYTMRGHPAGTVFGAVDDGRGGGGGGGGGVGGTGSATWVPSQAAYRAGGVAGDGCERGGGMGTSSTEAATTIASKPKGFAATVAQNKATASGGADTRAKRKGQVRVSEAASNITTWGGVPAGPARSSVRAPPGIPSRRKTGVSRAADGAPARGSGAPTISPRRALFEGAKAAMDADIANISTATPPVADVRDGGGDASPVQGPQRMVSSTRSELYETVRAAAAADPTPASAALSPAAGPSPHETTLWTEPATAPVEDVRNPPTNSTALYRAVHSVAFDPSQCPSPAPAPRATSTLFRAVSAAMDGDNIASSEVALDDGDNGGTAADSENAPALVIPGVSSSSAAAAVNTTPGDAVEDPVACLPALAYENDNDNDENVFDASTLPTDGSAAELAASLDRSSASGAVGNPPADISTSMDRKIFVVSDDASLKEAIAAMKASVDKAGTGGRLSSTFRGTGTVAVRFEGHNLGSEEGVISTVQIAGASPFSLIFDVKCLLETASGRNILSTELCPILNDRHIRKAMHDVHDQAAALARLFPRTGRINSILDLQLAHEMLGGRAINSFAEALSCSYAGDLPRINLSAGENATAKRPLTQDILEIASNTVSHLHQCCRMAESALEPKYRAWVYEASQMKADFAATFQRDGWRRMTFVDREHGRTGAIGKTLASYDIHKVREMSVELHDMPGQGENPRSASATPSGECSTENKSESPFSPTRSRSKSPPLSNRANAGNTQPDEQRRVSPRDFKGDMKPRGPNGTAYAAEGFGVANGENTEFARGITGNQFVGGKKSVGLDGPEGCEKVDGFDSERGGDEEGQGGGGGDVGIERGTRSRFPGNLSGSCDAGIYSQEEDADLLAMLKHLPKAFLTGVLSTRNREILYRLEQVELDLGTRPRALVRGQGRVHLCEDEDILVTRFHIGCVVGKFEDDGLLDPNNRTGFDGLLHSVAVMRDKNGIIYGVTIRVGRFAKGCADTIDDLLFNSSMGGNDARPPSILILGHQSTGKTTLIRDICRKLSATQSVVIVDTNNEIGGDGIVPHKDAIGDSRRVMVPDDTYQHRVMIQALRNHSPDTIVVDEISSEADVEACQKIRSRGVRVVAGAVGDLPSVLDSASLGLALGGLEDSQDASDSEDGSASSSHSVAKSHDQKERRAGKPIFDAVVELEDRKQRRWSVVQHVASVVDELLSTGCVAKSDVRTPLPVDGITQKDGDKDGDKRNKYNGFLLKVVMDQSDKWLW